MVYSKVLLLHCRCTFETGGCRVNKFLYIWAPIKRRVGEQIGRNHLSFSTKIELVPFNANSHQVENFIEILLSVKNMKKIELDSMNKL